MKCPFCGQKNISKNGKKRGEQRYICNKCKKSFIPTVATIDPSLKNIKLKIVEADDLEQILLNGILENCRTSPQWAKLALQVLEHICPKYKDIKGKNFTPEDYKKFLDESQKVDIRELLKIAMQENSNSESVD